MTIFCVMDGHLQLPAEISNLENLTVLSLANNRIESFPEEITFLVQLKWLNLSGNRIPVIPGSVQRIRYLEAFWCNNSQVVSVDEEGIGLCYHLNTLGLRGNRIQTLPDNLSQLTNLTWLTLENNQIHSLPQSMELLANLIHLNVQNNCLDTVPDFFHKLRSLKYVFLNSNRIKSVHLMDLYHTNHLRAFDLNHNPFPDEHIIPVLKVGNLFNCDSSLLDQSTKCNLLSFPALPTCPLLEQPHQFEVPTVGRRSRFGH